MEILTKESQIEKDVQFLLNWCEQSQWIHKPDFDFISNFEIMTRSDLRQKDLRQSFGISKTSGSTGEPVTVAKSYRDHIWYITTSIRELRWLKWDMSKDIAFIRAGNKLEDGEGWGLPKSIVPLQGRHYKSDLVAISELQSWLENKNPHYIHCLPSVFKQLDTKKISNFISWKGTGEVGANCYSSEECGVIALRCPDNPLVYHVMENQIVECDQHGGLIITTKSNSHIRRYKHGDHIKLGQCPCGRSLQTITEIHGRVRNMMILPNGDKKWPQIGSLHFEDFGIKRFKMIQKEVTKFQLQLISSDLKEKEQQLIDLVLKIIGFSAEIEIKYLDSFPNYKFEEFICQVR